MTDAEVPAEEVFRKSVGPSPPPPGRARWLVPTCLLASFVALAALSVWSGAARGPTDPLEEETASLARNPNAERWVFRAGEAKVGVALHDPRDSTLLVWVRGLPALPAASGRWLWSVRKDDPAGPRRVGRLGPVRGERPDLVVRDVPALDAYEALLVSREPEGEPTAPTDVEARASPRAP